MKKTLLVALLVAICTAPSWSQTAGAKVQGTVKSDGKPIAGAEVIITNADASATYKGKTDDNGVFEVDGVPTGNDYKLEVVNAAGLKVFVSQQLSFNAEAGAPAVLAIDTSDLSKTNLSAAAAKRHYSSEEIAALRAQNARAQQQNTLITQALNAMNARQWQEAIPPLQQLIATDPDRYEFYQSLGDAQMNLAHYDEAIQAYEKGVQVAGSNSAADPRNPANDPAKKKSRVVSMLANQGNCFLKSGKPDDAIAAFKRATTIDPTSGVAQFNLCATLYNSQKLDALPACEKAITLEPDRPEPYFIKGRLLFTRNKRLGNGRLQVPPGTAQALNKYLQLRPEGPFAQLAKDMLAQIGAAPANPDTGTRK